MCTGLLCIGPVTIYDPVSYACSGLFCIGPFTLSSVKEYRCKGLQCVGPFALGFTKGRGRRDTKQKVTEEPKITLTLKELKELIKDLTVKITKEVTKSLEMNA